MRLVDEIKQELQPKLLLPSITVGVLAGVMDIGVELSLAAFIFSGDLSQFLAGGIGILLFGALVVGTVVGLITSVPSMIAVPQDTSAAILALMAAGIAAVMKASQPKAIFATVLAAIAVTSLLRAMILLAV